GSSSRRDAMDEGTPRESYAAMRYPLGSAMATRFPSVAYGGTSWPAARFPDVANGRNESVEGMTVRPAPSRNGSRTTLALPSLVRVRRSMESGMAASGLAPAGI